MTARFELELAVDVDLQVRRSHIVDDVDPEPPVVDVRNRDHVVVVVKGAVVDSEHQGRVPRERRSKDLRDAHARSAARHVPVRFELPHSGVVDVLLRS